MTALEICASAEDRVRRAQGLLADPRVESLEQALGELASVIGALEEISHGALESGLRAPLERLRAMAGLLARQIEHASNLYLGFIQLQLANGYTRQGLPLVAGETRNSVEA